jgi:hypothetical protein
LEIGWSEIYILIRKGERIPPWRTPAKIFSILDTEDPNWIWK